MQMEIPLPGEQCSRFARSCTRQSVGCVDEVPLLGEHPYSWGLSSSLFSWSLSLPPVQANESVMVSIWSKAGPWELKQRSKGSLKASKRCQPCSVPIQPRHAGLLGFHPKQRFLGTKKLGGPQEGVCSASACGRMSLHLCLGLLPWHAGPRM